MIRIHRDRPDPLSEDGSPIRPSASWFALASASTTDARADGAAHEVREHVYRHVEVRKALEALFHEKCAYCESRIGATASWDVEHYRPKGRVENRKDHPGYYWLAYEWTNLYPACQLCNQKRKDQALWEDPQALPAKGKSDKFPLIDETKRAMSPEHDISHESPLLLDPCDVDDDPEKHFEYDAWGGIHPRSEDHHCATATIEICHLHRRRLQKGRVRILRQVVDVLQALQEARSQRQDQVVPLLERLLQEHFLADKATYAGLARYIARDPEAFLPVGPAS